MISIGWNWGRRTPHLVLGSRWNRRETSSSALLIATTIWILVEIARRSSLGPSGWEAVGLSTRLVIILEVEMATACIGTGSPMERVYPKFYSKYAPLTVRLALARLAPSARLATRSCSRVPALGVRHVSPSATRLSARSVGPPTRGSVWGSARLVTLRRICCVSVSECA